MSPNVTELVNNLHAEAHRGQAALLSRYVELVQQAAKDKLSPEQAAEVARLAYEMELPPDRFDRDLAIVQGRASLEAQIQADEAQRATERERAEAGQARIKQLEQELKEARFFPHTLFGEAMARQQRQEQVAKTIAEHPHLFADAATLTAEQWNTIRN